MVLETAHLPHCNSSATRDWLSQDEDDGEAFDLDAGRDLDTTSISSERRARDDQRAGASWALRRIQALANKIFLLTKPGSKMR
jgi:hypothetical protein